VIHERGLIADELPSVEAIAAAVSERFTVGPVTTERDDFVYYDTFDALLREAGATFVWRGGVAPDPAALDDRIRAVIGVRALLPQARIQSVTDTVPLLDELDKTIVRVDVASPVVVVDGVRKPLPPRLFVRGVRGYDEECRAACDLLVTSLPLRRAERTLHDEAVSAAGGDPAGLNSKPAVALGPSDRADLAAARVLAALLDVTDANLPGTLADIDTEFLHDYRVSIRRTRAILREFRVVFPPLDWQHFRAELKWLQGVTSDTRDLDVYVLGFEELRALVPEALRDDLQPLRGVLEHRRQRARREMVGELRGERARTLRDDWAGFLEGLGNRALDDRPDAGRSIDSVSARRIRKLHRKMVMMGEVIVEAGGGPAGSVPAVDYHELRKKGKELRYLLEFFGLALRDPAVVRPLIRALKGLQEVLGRHQDREVQIQTLRQLGPEVAALPDGHGALMAMGVLIERLERDAASARREFADSFAEFASAEQRGLVKDTFS
jgi:CHAD domain-containing protein